MNDTPTPSGRLLQKLARVQELANIINLSADRILPIEDREAIDNEQFRMEFALKNLVDEVREKEADIKIKHMENVVSILKKQPNVQP